MVYRAPRIHDGPEDWADYYHKLKYIGYAALPNCPKCAGSGRIHPRIEGKISYQSPLLTCEFTGCLADSFKAYKSGESYLKSIGVMSTEQVFGTFRQEIGTQAAYAAFFYLAWPEQGPAKKRIPFLLCYGNPGNGKTHLCNALAIELNEQKIGVRLYAVADLLTDLWAGMKDHTVDLKLNFLKSIPALILDDYGVNFGADRELAWIDEIWTARFREEKITVMTMNKGFETLTPRIKSRFMDNLLSVAVLNEGIDQRPLKKDSGGKSHE
jgi:DNA replication protein DnaC